jgi:hypothetical protein
MGNRTRLPDMLVKWRSRAEAAAARAEAERVIERWNRAISMGRDVLAVAHDPLRDRRRPDAPAGPRCSLA